MEASSTFIIPGSGGGASLNQATNVLRTPAHALGAKPHWRRKLSGLYAFPPSARGDVHRGKNLREPNQLALGKRRGLGASVDAFLLGSVFASVFFHSDTEC